jgi:hypothetical protein
MEITVILRASETLKGMCHHGNVRHLRFVLNCALYSQDINSILE